MNLYIFSDNCSGSMYGIGTYVRELTASLKGVDVNICVINLFSDVPQIVFEEKDDIAYWNFPKPIQEYSRTNTIEQWRLYYHNVIYLLQLHIKEKKELIFQLNYNYSDDFPNALIEAFDCKVIACVHYLSWCLSLNGNVSSFRLKLATSETTPVDDLQNSIYKSYLKEKSFFDKVDRIVCLSEFARNILQHDYQISADKIDVVYNGLTDKNNYDSKSMLMLKKQMLDIPIILFVGRVDCRKGLMHALRAFRKVLSVQPCQFIIAGNGDFDILMKECEDIWMNVTWTGKLDSNKLCDLYSIADIGVLPSFAEQCSYVAIEMMMHGIPIVASTSTGLSEMVEEGYNGLHIPINEYPNSVDIDITLLADKIISLLQNPVGRERMQLNARSQYEKCYTSEIMGRKMLDIYHSLLKDN